MKRSVDHWSKVRFGDIVTHSAFGPRFSGGDYAEDGNVATLRTTDLDNHGRISYGNMPLARLNKIALRTTYSREAIYSLHVAARVVLPPSSRNSLYLFWQVHS